MAIKGAVHIDRPLTDLSIARMNDLTDYVARQVFPLVGVPHKTGDYYVWDKEVFYEDLAQKRAPCSESVGGHLVLASDKYNCDVYSIHHDICDQTVANQDQAVDLESAAVLKVVRAQLLRQEVDFADRFMTNAGNWDRELDAQTIPGAQGGGAWDAAGDPLIQLTDCICEMQKTSSLTPNTLVLTFDAWCKMKNNAAVIDRIKGGSTSTDAARVMLDMIAQQLELDRVLVMKANVKTASGVDRVASDSALLLHVADSPGLATESAGYTFTWDFASIGTDGAVPIERIEDRKCQSTRIESSAAWDQKLVSSDLGCLIHNVCT